MRSSKAQTVTPVPDPWASYSDSYVSMVAEGEEAGVVLADLAAQAGIPVSAGEMKDSVSVSFRRIPVRQAVEVVCSSVRRSPEFVGGVLMFPPAGRSYVTIPSSGYANPESARAAFEALVGDTGIVKVVDGSVVVLGDDVSIRRANTLAQSLMSVKPARWTFCVWVVEVSEDFSRQLGVQLNYRGLVEVAASGANVGTVADALLRASLVADGNESAGRVVSRGTLVALEGSEGTLDSGLRVPVPRRTVSNFGVVTVSGFDYVEAGFSLTVKPTPVPGGAVRVDLKPSISSISGYVEGSPILARRAVSTSATVADGDWLVLAGLDEASVVDSSSGFFGQVRRAESSSRRVFLVVKALRDDT